MADGVPALGRSARLKVLVSGYVGRRVGSTVTYLEEGPFRAIVDPGMVSSRERILGPLRRLGVAPPQITDVILSHHHPDHSLNCALFPRARVHDFWAVYDRDRWISRPAEGARLSPSVVLLETPGHTPQDITTLVGTSEGVAALTHLWWNRNGPARDPLADNLALLERNRARILRLADRAVPGHGAPFSLVGRRGQGA